MKTFDSGLKLFLFLVFNRIVYLFWVYFFHFNYFCMLCTISAICQNIQLIQEMSATTFVFYGQTDLCKSQIKHFLKSIQSYLLCFCLCIQLIAYSKAFAILLTFSSTSAKCCFFFLQLLAKVLLLLVII